MIRLLYYLRTKIVATFEQLQELGLALAQLALAEPALALVAKRAAMKIFVFIFKFLEVFMKYIDMTKFIWSD